jgi:hypothetical protein
MTHTVTYATYATINTNFNIHNCPHMSLYILVIYFMQNDQVKEDEVGTAHSTNEGEEECI